jgi:type IV secretion system protein VirB1
MDFDVLAAECAPWVAPQTLAAIVKTESRFKPFAININGGSKLERQPANKEEAVATAKWLIEHRYNIDLGLGQINSVNLAKTNLGVEDAFDPCKNLAASATILRWNYESASQRVSGDEQVALKAAISAYNTGSYTRGFSNGYVQKVVNNAGASKQPAANIAEVTTIQPIKLVNIGKANNINKPVIVAKVPSVEKEEKVAEAEGKVTGSENIYRVQKTARDAMVYR